MTKEQIKTKMEEREEFIVSILKEDPKSTVTGKSIDDAVGITAGNRVMYMRKLMKKYPQIQNVGKKEAEYKWVEDAPVSIKNHEGYPDPTAQKAIAATEAIEIPKIKTDLKPKKENYSNVYRKSLKPSPGEIWTASESSGKSYKFIVAGVFGDYVQCIKCFPAEESYELGESEVIVEINSQKYVWDPARLGSKPIRYFERRTKLFDLDLLKDVRSRVGEILGIKPPKVEIREKIVYKEKDDACWAENEELKKRVTELTEQMAQMMHGEPAPVPENYVECRTAELAIVTEQRDIWKTVALKLLEGRA